jgi:hypothetical protein
MMCKLILQLVVLAMAMALVACSEKPTNMSKVSSQLKKNKFHGDSMETNTAVPKRSITDELKKIHLNGYPQKTIGAAFDSYNKVASREWHEALGRDGKYYVDFICWFPSLATSVAAKKAGATKQGLNIKFAIQDDGTAYVTLGMKLAMMPDGNVVTEVVPLVDVPKIIDVIYADRELTF